MGEVHLHGQNTDILGAGVGGVGGSAVGVDTVCSGHFSRESESGGEEKEGDWGRRGWRGKRELLTRFYSNTSVGPIFRIVPFKNGRPIIRTPR